VEPERWEHLMGDPEESGDWNTGEGLVAALAALDAALAAVDAPMDASNPGAARAAVQEAVPAALMAVTALIEGAKGRVAPWVRDALAAGQAAYDELRRLTDNPNE
jgi:hypothetical protein